jgi:hypothetical protein
MRRDRFIGALALTGALAGGGVAGAVLGVPGISGAQSTTSEATTTSTTAPSTTTTVAPDPGGGERGECHFGPGPGFSPEAAATALGISEADLRTELRNGKTIAEVAKDKGVDVQKVIDALVADATEHIDQAVTDEKLTAERAAAIKEGLADRITRLVNEGGRFKGGHPPFGERNGFPGGGVLPPGGPID